MSEESRLSWVAQYAAADSAEYFVCRFVRLAGRFGQQVPLADPGLRELPVHLSGCRLVGESVAAAGGHSLCASLRRGEQHRECRQSRPAAAAKSARNHGPTTPSYTVAYPPAA